MHGVLTQPTKLQSRGHSGTCTACSDVPSDLRVVTQLCWIREFSTWVINKGYLFPVPKADFDALVVQFVRTQLLGDFRADLFAWIRDDRLKASYVSFEVDVRLYSPAEEALRYKELWNEYIDAYNAQASRFARGAWHSSALWGLAESQSYLVSSTLETLLVLGIVAFMGMLVFTRDACLSSAVVLATASVVCGLFFFIVVLQGWAIGPIEVIALIVLVGYAATYSLHIAHIFSSPEALHEPRLGGLSEDAAVRWQRMRFSLKTLGSAMVGSALTTAGCSAFLLFCEIIVFQRLGGVILMVTLISIVVALGPLPATLVLIGPARPGSCRRRMSCRSPGDLCDATFDVVDASWLEQQEVLPSDAPDQLALPGSGGGGEGCCDGVGDDICCPRGGGSVGAIRQDSK